MAEASRDPAGANLVHPKTGDQGRRDCDDDREHAPGALVQGVDDHLRRGSQRGHHDEQHGDRGGDAHDGSQQVSGDFWQRLPILPHRGQEHDEVVDPAGQARADHNPAEAGKIAPLRGQDRPNQRPRARNGRKVDAEQHQPPRGVIIDVVAEPVGRRDAPVVQNGHFCRQKGPIEPIGHQKRGQGGNHQPERVHRAPFRNFTIIALLPPAQQLHSTVGRRGQMSYNGRRGPHSESCQTV